MTDARIASLEELPDGGTFLFTVRAVDEDEDEEAILVRTEDGVVCWLNYCQHFTHVRLDKGSGAEMRHGEIVCTDHGAMFDVESGTCTHGPCEGAVLTEVAVTVEDGSVYLSDDRFEFVSVGPCERDGLDLASTSNVEF